MPKLICNCPKCKSQLRCDSGDQKQLKIICPKCQNQFQIQVPSASAAAETTGPATTGPAPKTSARPPAPEPLSEPFSNWPQSPPLESYNRTIANRSQPKHKNKASGNSRKLLLPAILTLASIGGVGLVFVGIMWGKQFIPGGTSSGSLSSAFSGSLFSSDSRTRVEADLQALRMRVEEIGRSIPAGDQSEASAQRLLAELPKFHALFRRACKLPIKEVSMQEFASGREKMRVMLEQLRNQSQASNGSPTTSPFPSTFWSVNTSAKPDEWVVHAINEVTLSSNSVTTIMSEALIDLPDPQTYTGPEFEWSDEDRRVLAIIRLQGSMERDALRALASVDPKAPSPSDLNRLHSRIDQAVESANELRKLPGKSLGGMLAFVPKGNPYEPQQVSAMIGLNNLQKFMKAEATLPDEVNFLFDEVKAFGEMTEGIIFGSQGGSLLTHLASAPTSKERFAAFVAAEEKKKVDALQAEIDRQEDEKRRLADAQLRKQKAEEEQRQQEEDRKRALEERMADARSGKTGGRLGSRGPNGLTENIGPRPGPMGVPTGPNGVPSGPGPTGSMSNGQQPGYPPNFPGFGAGPPGISQNRFQPPTASQGDPAKTVIITCANVKNGDSSAYLRDLPKWLLQYAPSISISNGNLKITVQNYDKPLADLEPCFPLLVFDKIDTESRTIVAKEK